VQIGPYALLEPLDRSGPGVVYRARGPEGSAAVRVLPAGVVREEDVERLRTALAAGRRVVHPGVVRVLGVGVADGQAWIARDLVAGPSLAARVERDGPLEPAAVVRLGGAVARALAALHGRGLLHLRVTPASVVFDAGGRPLLADVGLARLLGSPAGPAADDEGLAPELRAGGPGAAPGPAADVFGLGVTLYVALTGRPPAADGAPRPPSTVRPGVDAALEAIVLRCLRPEPGARFATAAGLARALEGWSEARATGGRPVLVLATTLVAAAVLAGVVAVGSGRGDGARPAAPARSSAPRGGARAGATPRAGESSPGPPARGGADAPAPDPDDELARAAELLATGRLAAARALLDARLAVDPGDAAALRLRGRAAFAAGDLEAALADLEAAFEAGAPSADGWHELAAWRAYRGELVAAADACERALDLDPEHLPALVLLESLQAELEAAAGEVAALEAAAAEEPESPERWLELARAARVAGDVEAAVAAAGRATTLDPASGQAWRALGEALAAARVAEEADRAYGRAVALDPRDAEALAGRGAVRIRLERPVDAVVDTTRALEVAPEHAEALLHRAIARYQLGDLPGARVDAVRLAAAAPDHPWARQLLALVGVGVDDDGAGDDDGAAPPR